MIPRITSLTNPRIKQLARLRDGRCRRRQRQFLVDGLREIDRALSGPFALRQLVVDSEALEARSGPGDRLRALVEQVAAQARPGTAAPPLLPVTAKVLEKLAYGDRNEGAVALFDTPELDLQRIALGAQPLLVVLDRVEKPGNVGAVVRSADAVGARGVILSDCGGDPFHPNTIRASLGTVFTVPLAVATAAEVQRWLLAHHVQGFTARVEASGTLWQTDLRGATALVFGGEATGLGARWEGPSLRPLRIPMAGVADSLNLSVSAALCLFEARRQRSAS